MAVVTTKAGAITNRDASPRALSDSIISKGMLKEAVGTIETNGDDSIGSKYVFAQVPSHARVSAVLLSCDGNNTTGAGNIGLYRTTDDGGAVVDADLFASAQVITSALTNSDVTHESGQYGIEDIEKPLWEALGLSEDPNLMYDVVMTLTAADDAADTVSLKIQYVE